MNSPSSLLTQKAVEVQVKNLCKSFGEQHVLSNVSFNVSAGEIFVIMGPSGSGKSVLLKTIIGLESSDSGQILIDGQDASLPQTHQNLITSIVFQASALFSSLNVFDNLALYPREHRLYSKSELQDQVFETLRILNLESSAYKMPSELSGGMRKRVAIARALMMRPQLLLYDEPTSELDPLSAASICEIIGTLKDQFGVTSLVVSHDTNLALSIANHVAVLIDGEIQELATPEELSRTKNKKIQEFLNPKIDIQHPRFKSYINI